MARLITMPVAPPSAWKKRAAISCGSVSAKMLPTPAATISPSPANSTGRRPKRSDSGPMMSCENASPTMYSDTVIWAMEMSRSNTRASSGSAGTSMYSEIGATPVIATSRNSMTRDFEWSMAVVGEMEGLSVT